MSGHGRHHPISLTGASQAKPSRHRVRLDEVIPFFLFPPSPPPHSNHHRHLSLPPKISSSTRRSGHLPHSLRQPPPSPGASCSGTCVAADVAAFRPPESRRPLSPSPL
ncbi:Os02g0616600 [Oryza sativa Japonica Group]|uniref:Os02g0616600 protein n=1 Tax=Oryza sativa subsp. japonica TaxID=39947 RepID=B7EZJ6_ORYSJ|nr:unnamed protein product [Oryza sativa Japonica Group]BAS79780.1 Os02g0616600 [Oryza sativa Japonica Group]